LRYVCSNRWSLFCKNQRGIGAAKLFVILMCEGSGQE
jgi:hypothetical protein